MKNLLGMLIALMVLMTSSVACARIYGNDDPAVLNDMYENPMHYIHIGSDNFGLSFYLDRTTVNVHEYDPPNYVIAFKNVYHLFTPDLDQKVLKEYAGYAYDGIRRYKYDYSSRKMYVEKYDSTGNPYWELLAPLSDEQQRKMIGGEIRGYERDIAQGEIAFFLAYGISFYEHPETDASENFIINGRSRMMPLLKLNLLNTTNDTTHTSHEYNHKTNKIEVWQYTYNKATHKIDSKRIG